MSTVQGSDLGVLWGERLRLDFTHHMMLILQGPGIKAALKDPTRESELFCLTLSKHISSGASRAENDRCSFIPQRLCFVYLPERLLTNFPICNVN